MDCITDGADRSIEEKLMLKLALRNIFRNFRRSVLTGLSITFAVMIVIYVWSFVMGVLDGAFEQSILTNYAHIKITKKEYVKREKMLPIDQNITGLSTTDSWKTIAAIASKDPDVILTCGRIKFGVLLEKNDKNYPVLGIGIDPVREKKFADLSERIVKGKAIRNGTEEANIGFALADELGLKLGDELTVVTQTQFGSITAMDLKVCGLFNYGTTTMDRKVFYMPLGKAQKLLDMDGAVTEILVLIKDKEKAREVAIRINKKLDEMTNGIYIARAWQDQMTFYAMLAFAKAIYMVIYALVLILASFTIFNTMFMSVLERTKEIGMMKALGMRNGQIIKLVIYEAMLIGIFASIIGAVFGALISYYLSVYGINFSAALGKLDTTMSLPYIYKALFRWSYVITGALFGVFFAVIAAIPPALRAAKMEPSEALHET